MRVIGIGQAAAGVIALIFGVMATNTWLNVAFGAAGAGFVASGLRILRSKVSVDQDAMHIRGILGWRCMEWSAILQFEVEALYTRAGTIYSIVILRSSGRIVRPLAIAAETAEDAQHNVDLLESFRRAK